MKSLNYFAVMFGGMPMTFNGARRFLLAAMNEGHSYTDCLKFVPDEHLSPIGLKDKQGDIKSL